jgi:hypothetical protein
MTAGSLVVELVASMVARKVDKTAYWKAASSGVRKVER